MTMRLADAAVWPVGSVAGNKCGGDKKIASIVPQEVVSAVLRKWLAENIERFVTVCIGFIASPERVRPLYG
jgi:pyridoxal/pyridoxine/pyridoxamine kinase